MPLATDPKATFPIVLESDKKKPPSKQPKFIYRPLTVRQFNELSRFTDRIDALKEDKNASGGDMGEIAVNAAATNLIDWENMTDLAGKKIRFSPKKLADLVTFTEACELVFTLIASAVLSFDVKKKLESPSGSSTEPSAKTVKE